MRKTQLVLALSAMGLAASAHATNGMNLEGYGPIAAAMGGASMAYDNGTAAVMNNPATLGLMEQGSRLDVAVGMLGPDVSSSVGGNSANSGGDAYYMPAIGWAKKNGALTYGVAMFAQGGMGTEYSRGSVIDLGGSGLKQRSELGVGRLILPLTYDASPDLTIGGSLDVVWAMMDLQMALSGAQFLGMTNPASAYGQVGGSMMARFNDYVAGTNLTGFNPFSITLMNPVNPVNWGYFDFSDSSDYTGKTKTTGFAGKIGFTYKMKPNLTIGGVYHSKTSLGNMKGDADVSFNANVDDGVALGGAPTGTYGTAATIPVSGKISIVDFEWPETIGLGMAYQASDKLMIAVDYKRINWAAVMKDFKMTFTADGTQANPFAAGFAGSKLDATLYQDWDDQDIFSIGVAYKATNALTLRAGANIAGNPIPSALLNPLFPAIEKTHYTLGFGYAFDKSSDINFSVQYAPEVKDTIPDYLGAGTSVVVEHSQTSWQLMYSKRF
jgi:long-chain fatty acid transport protein